MPNIFGSIPAELPHEFFEDIVKTDNLRIERIVSKGHTSPDTGWYDQAENEWVIVLSGYGVIEYEDGTRVTLTSGDYVNIKAHKKHRVVETSKDEATLWLAIFY
ncbi:cupin domain-containing protein [Maricurvus nonylphenolicus]|uniref:cupin domain-containing protein n=1 Tax=Maricurvus nonylphenolicus TaxID=1008307 RepID=UPI0036F2A809